MRNGLIIIVGIFLTACGITGPQTGAPASTDAVRAFYVGLAALQVGDDPRAKDELSKATQLAPNEPAVWTNLGILQIRHKDFDAAAQSLEKARSLADKNPRIYETIALLEKQRGNFDASQTNLQKAIDLDPNNVKAMYALAEEKERQADDAAASRAYKQIFAARPNNIAVWIDVMRLEAKQKDLGALRETLEKHSATFEHLEPEIRDQFRKLAASVSSENIAQIPADIAYLRNVLLRHPGFRTNTDELKYSDTSIGEPFTKPLVLQVPSSSPAPADTALEFEPQPADSGPALWNKFVYLNGDHTPVVAAHVAQGTRIGPTTILFTVERAEGVVAFDYDYDFKNDIAIAGSKGFRLYRQTDAGFTDVTTQTKLSEQLIDGWYVGVWTLDVESDGDLDLVLGSVEGPAAVLQNNSDGTFSVVNTFSGIDGLAQFASVDIDEDGDADVIAVDGSKGLHFFTNLRGGQFQSLDDPVNGVAGFDIGDVNGDGKLEILVLHEDGGVDTLASKGGPGLEITRLFQDTGLTRTRMSVTMADLDNNGAQDIVLGGDQRSAIWFCDPQRHYLAPLGTIDARFTSFADVNADGRLDATGLSGKGAGIFLNRGTKTYNWQDVRPRAAKATGDQRVNSFGIGGELELRAGLSLQKQLITEPVMHFGLGENPRADVLRVVWQNGFAQAEFDLKPNQPIAAEQRLKGSCPHLFTWDGEKFFMVKDAPPWSPALGLKINAQDTFGVIETQEWFKVPGDALKPTKENSYELRITGEYWETYYVDQYSLLVVDHPANTEIFTDERFSVPPALLEVFTTGPLHAISSARNDKGEDVTSIVSTIDEKYLDGFERATFQGVAKDHFVEIELPADAPVDKRIAIVADGWVHPTDASINVQLGQSSKEKPRSLSLEVRDDKGEWKVARENLGFPAGKMKTLLFELPLGTRAARLRTNMEVFWDKLAWAVYDPGDANRTTRVELNSSELRYRGFSVIEKADDSSPEKPDYDRLLTTTQRWRSMEGYYTRFGDVLELLTQVDDRYVLMNAGEEVVLKFKTLPDPPAGMKRDFVLIGNGWIKDGDLNSVFSKTVLPLPTHASNDYSKPPTTLEADPVYQKHKADWVNFHTRYVSPDAFRNALR